MFAGIFCIISQLHFCIIFAVVMASLECIHVSTSCVYGDGLKIGTKQFPKLKCLYQMNKGIIHLLRAQKFSNKLTFITLLYAHIPCPANNIRYCSHKHLDQFLRDYILLKTSMKTQHNFYSIHFYILILVAIFGIFHQIFLDFFRTDGYSLILILGILRSTFVICCNNLFVSFMEMRTLSKFCSKHYVY